MIFQSLVFQESAILISGVCNANFAWSSQCFAKTQARVQNLCANSVRERLQCHMFFELG